MAMRGLALLCAAFVFAPCAPAQTGAPVPAAVPAMRKPVASDRAWETEAVRAALDQSLYPVAVKMGAVQGNSVPVEVDLQNLSPKTITAYSVSFVEHRADGSERTQFRTEDILGETVLARVPGNRVVSSPGTLNSHEIRPVKTTLWLDPGTLPPTDITAKVTMIVFEDRTALGNPFWVQTTLDGRKKGSEADGALLAELRKVLARPEVQNVSEPDQTKALQRALADRIGEIKRGGAGAGWTPDQITKLQLFHNALMLSRQHFDQMMSNWEILQRAAAEQSSLEVTNQ